MDNITKLDKPLAVRDISSLNLVNLALGKPASQSSYSEWSQPGEAKRAVQEGFAGSYAFHTAKEDQPWWRVDLGSTYPIECITVSNREDGFEERARTLKVEISEDGAVWSLIHAGFAAFGSYANGRPISFLIASELQARHVRLSLSEYQYFHLSRVEIWVKPELVALTQFCETHKLPFYHTRKNPTESIYTTEIWGQPEPVTVVGLKINYSGRFGNLLHQYVNTIQFALRTGLRVIQLGRHELLDIKARFTVGGITFVPHDDPLPLDGVYLCGEFFNSDDLMPVLPPFLQFQAEDEIEFTGVVQTYILPYMLTGIPINGEIHPSNELTIHIRSGDIFASDHPVTYGYRQPPLSFYQLVVRRMRLENRIETVRLVFEDRGNPCIDALETWLKAELIPYRVSCGSLQEDMSALIDAPHLVFGHGTFGYAACRLSKRIETVHYFEPELGGSYGAIPTISEVFAVSDKSGKYIKAFQYGRPFGPEDGWRNTVEMRQRMLNFPINDITIARIRC